MPAGERVSARLVEWAGVMSSINYHLYSSPSTFWPLCIANVRNLCFSASLVLVAVTALLNAASEGR